MPLPFLVPVPNPALPANAIDSQHSHPYRAPKRRGKGYRQMQSIRAGAFPAFRPATAG